MDQFSRLEALPEELLDGIARFTDDRGLFSLRLTSKEVHYKITNAFYKLCFRERRVYLERQHLDSFAKSLECSKIRLAVQSLLIYFDPWSLEGVDQDLQDWTQLEHETQNCLYNKYVEKDYMISSGEASTQLAHIMSSLPNLDEVTIWHGVEPYFSHRTGPLHPDHFDNVFLRDREKSDDQTFLAIMGAILNSKLRIMHLHVCGFEGTSRSLSVEPMISITTQLPRLKLAFERLDSLDMSVRTPDVQLEGRYWQSSFRSFLVASSNISNLYLCFGGSDFDDRANFEGRLAMPDFDWPVFPNLRILCLVNPQFRVAQLYDFLKHHQTLQILELDEIWFRDEDHFIFDKTAIDVFTALELQGFVMNIYGVDSPWGFVAETYGSVEKVRRTIEDLEGQEYSWF